MKLIICGVSKCGTTSLERYLKDQGHEVISSVQLVTLSFGTMIYQYHYTDYRPVIILRDPKKREKSVLNNLEDQTKSDMPHLINIANIKAQWGSLNAIFYNLEDLAKNPNFPKLNVSQDQNNLDAKLI